MNINEWVIISNFNLSQKGTNHTFSFYSVFFSCLRCPYESLMYPLLPFIILHFHTTSIQIAIHCTLLILSYTLLQYSLLYYQLSLLLLQCLPITIQSPNTLQFSIPISH